MCVVPHVKWHRYPIRTLLRRQSETVINSRSLPLVRMSRRLLIGRTVHQRSKASWNSIQVSLWFSLVLIATVFCLRISNFELEIFMLIAFGSSNLAIGSDSTFLFYPKYLYRESTYYFTWDKDKMLWKPREHRTQIGKLVYICALYFQLCYWLSPWNNSP